jgi:hypothetical protein
LQSEESQHASKTAQNRFSLVVTKMSGSSFAVLLALVSQQRPTFAIFASIPESIAPVRIILGTMTFGDQVSCFTQLFVTIFWSLAHGSGRCHGYQGHLEPIYRRE